MTCYRMALIDTSAGVRRDIEEWDDGLENFGYVARQPHIALFAHTLDEARDEAATHWRYHCGMSGLGAGGQAEGYWIITPDHDIVEIMLAEDDGPPVPFFNRASL